MQDPDKAQIYLITAIIIVGMLLMAGAIILFVVFYQKRMIQEQLKRQVLESDYQQKMMQAELESQESERRRLAADLHDSIGGMLSTIRVGLATLGKTLSNPSTIDETKKMLDDTISSVRRISRDLMPSTLDKFGLDYALKELCERFQGTSRINIVFSVEGSSDDIDRQRQLMIFRIIQELLNNAVKHSQGTTINVSLVISNNFTASVEDNGIGFDAEAIKTDKISTRGLGLYNIENRARLLGGTVHFEKNSPKGSRTTLNIPLQA